MAVPRLYLGYGLLASQPLVEELLGRHLRAWEREMTIYGFDLKVLRREELPRKVQDATDEGFRIYGLTDDPRGSALRVLILDLSEQERNAVRALNFENDLFKPLGVSVGITADIDILKDPTLGKPFVDGINYPRFLNGEASAMTTARGIRTTFIQAAPEGSQGRGKERI